MILRYLLYSLLLGIAASIVGAVIAVKQHPERFTNFMGMDQQLLTRVPQFQLEDIDGRLHTYTEWNGKILVLNFWATWCPPCREETPGFVELQHKYRDQDVQFVGIAIDDVDKVRDFMDTFGINYPMLIGNLQIVELSRKMGNRLEALPFTVIVDRDGYITKRYTRGLTKQDVEAVIVNELSKELTKNNLPISRSNVDRLQGAARGAYPGYVTLAGTQKMDNRVSRIGKLFLNNDEG